jgi:pimeloyl-ACP methyl ester carboxylesterase
LPGHGRSRGAGRKTILEYANIVREFLDALKIERAIIVGVSMGGAIAQTLALEFPERVAGLVLVGTGAKLRVAPEFLDGLKNDFENTARVLVENFYAPDTSPPTPLLQREGGRRELLVEKSLEQLRQTGSIVTYNDFAACDAFDIRERISAIAAPTLIVCGRDDKMTPLKYSEFLAQKIPHARLVVIENAGHMVMVEQDTAFGDALRKWLAAPA